MKKKKLFILMPDGVGLRNFAYTDFYRQAKDRNLDLTFWNNSAFDLTGMGLQEIKMENAKTHFLTDIFKKARVIIDLNLNIRRFHDTVYDGYRFKLATDTAVNIIKALCIRLLTFCCTSERGSTIIRKAIVAFERRTKFYDQCYLILQKERPDFVFCTNQRTTAAVAPILAAQDLQIPTGTFIFSWDNLPKATLVLEPDYYFVWSQYMKKELQQYYSFIKEHQILVTGTPQFEMHNAPQLLLSRDDFFEQYKLDQSKKYICYSGDDITTSPNDPVYLEDTAKAVLELNKEGEQLAIIFRRCPVDHSSRFDRVLEKYKSVIVPIDPKWERTGDAWNTIVPRKEDMILQINTIAHTEMVINLGSTMVFDYVTHRKPCAFINYDLPRSMQPDWSVKKIYQYVHFRSMPHKDAVLWIDNPESISGIIRTALHKPEPVVDHALSWFGLINQQPHQEASRRILEAIEEIIP